MKETWTFLVLRKISQLKNPSHLENLTSPGRHMSHSKDTWEGEVQGGRLKNTAALTKTIKSGME